MIVTARPNSERAVPTIEMTVSAIRMGGGSSRQSPVLVQISYSANWIRCKYSKQKDTKKLSLLFCHLHVTKSAGGMDVQGYCYANINMFCMCCLLQPTLDMKIWSTWLHASGEIPSGFNLRGEWCVLKGGLVLNKNTTQGVSESTVRIECRQNLWF